MNCKETCCAEAESKAWQLCKSLQIQIGIAEQALRSIAHCDPKVSQTELIEHAHKAIDQLTEHRQS